MVRARLLLLCACGAWFATASPARAGVISSFDSAGDVVTSPTRAPGTWYTDRYAPAGFASGQSGGGRTGVLQQSISSADSAANRPGAFGSAFYNTQGRAYDLAPGATGLGIELFVSQDWAGLNQNVAGAEGRLASLWGTGVDGSNTVSAYPIIEFNNQTGGFRVWNGTGWDNVGGFSGYGKWYDLGIELAGGNFNYYVNGSLVGSTSADGSVGLSSVILQGYNAGNSYDAYWDNARDAALAPVSAVPEPATLAVFGGLGLAAVGYRVRRNRSA